MSKKIIQKNTVRTRRKIRIRSKVSGTTERPRLSVFRSAKHISVQLIDDTKGNTLVAASDVELKGAKKGTPIEKAAEVGKLIAQKAANKKISRAVFDRSGFKYHGRVKSLADAAREGGLEF